MTLKYNIFKKIKGKDKYLLALELAEVKEIADIIFERLNKKIEALESIEASVDEKIKALETLIERADALNIISQGIGKHDEIASLGRKGMKSHEIADMLDIPVGEVELVLNLRTISSHAN